jgi:plastocyanin
VKQKITHQTNGSFDQNGVTAWRRNFRPLNIFCKGDSEFWFILISVLCFTLGCGSNERSGATDATTTQLPTNQSESAVINSAAAGSSTISGRVFFKGQAPAPKIIRMSHDAACAEAREEQVYAEDVVLNADPDLPLNVSERKSGLANAFVYVKTGLRQSHFAAPTEPVILDQQGCRYVPHVFGIQIGQTLKILNSDPTFHNVHAAAKKNKPFNLGMSKVEKVKTRTFDQVEVMVPLHCNVHPWMSAYAGVLDHPFYAVSDSTGRYELQALPAGEYKIAAWHEVFGVLEQEVILSEAKNKTIDFTFTRR